MVKKTKTIAVFAHPGHELRCFGFLQKFSAAIVYLSDASASTGAARTDASKAVLSAHGLTFLSQSFDIPDAQIYAAILQQDKNWFRQSFVAMRQLFIQEQPEIIITDSAEGYNPAHDLCHFLSLFAARNTVPQAKILVTPLSAHPHELDGKQPADCLFLDLSEQSKQNKRRVINAYIQSAGGQLAAEAQTMEAEFGPEIHGHEILRPAMSLTRYLCRYSTQKPYFERYGMQRVAQKKYKEVLRLSPHLAFALNLLSELSACEY